MEEYKKYVLVDFLSDPDFKDWVRNGRRSSHPVWPKFQAFFPEKSDDFILAVDLVKEMFDQGNSVSPEELDTEVDRILASTQSTGLPVSGRWYWAAAFVAIFAATWILLPATDNTPVAYQVLKETNPVSVLRQSNSSDSVVSFRLPDGSRADLYPGAQLTYLKKGFADTAYEGARREVYISGDVFFDVVKDSKRPFLVYTDNFITTVLGTSFLVKSSDKQTSVEVRTGRVMVTPLSQKEKWEVALTPNQKAVYANDENKIIRELAAEPIVLPNIKESVSFQFENTAINSVFEVLERAYGIPIRYDSVALAACSINVHLGEESFEDKLDIICATIHATYTTVNGEVVISGTECQ